MYNRGRLLQRIEFTPSSRLRKVAVLLDGEGHGACPAGALDKKMLLLRHYEDNVNLTFDDFCRQIRLTLPDDGKRTLR